MPTLTLQRKAVAFGLNLTKNTLLAPSYYEKQLLARYLSGGLTIDLGRIEALPIAGLVSKPLTREKVDTILKLHYQRQFPAA